jgi:hypothetical protein
MIMKSARQVAGNVPFVWMHRSSWPSSADRHPAVPVPAQRPGPPGQDLGFSPVGVKGLGEIGVVGVSAAIANAVYHATGRRIRSLPITIDQLLARGT